MFIRISARFLFAAYLAASMIPTHAAVHYDEARKVFRLDSSGVTYAFGINERGGLQPLYWGAALSLGDLIGPARSDPGVASQDPSTSTTPQEFAGWGQGLYTEPALKISFQDGNRDLVLHYVSYKIDGQTLTVLLKDIERNVFVTLRYQMDADTGIIGRSAVIENRGTVRIVVNSASAATWTLPHGSDYSLRYLAGRWGGEFLIHQQRIQPGETVLESRRGATGQQNNPWFAIARGDFANEESGDVWFGALAWSGSWRISVELDQVRQVRVTGGYNSFDFAYALAPGEHLETPVFYAGYSANGAGEASRLLHRFELAHILPQASQPRPRPVLYNSWEATEFNVDEAGQIRLAEAAAKIGIERFVMDDGWFGQRVNDHAGLGDWYVNPKKFPNGLKPLIDKVHALHMDFGLWVEPEMVNPDSDLYRKHPDWVLNFPGRPRTEARQQLVLNLARPDVRQYVFHFLDALLRENDISFLKWDYNRGWSEPGWPAIANSTQDSEQQKVYVKFTENLYSILAELRAKHPGLEIESCSSGGGRADLGIMHYTDQIWTSDDTDPFDRLRIQDGFTQAYSPGVMMAWVTGSPNWVNHRSTSLEYRFLSSMQGSLGVGDNLNNWTLEDFATATRLISAYKLVRDTVQHGSLYRLLSPRDGSEFSATESVSPDKNQAVIFAFLHSGQMGYPFPTLYVKGLDPDATYTLTPIAGKAAVGTLPVASGRYWMEHGLEPELHGDFQAAAFRLDKSS